MVREPTSDLRSNFSTAFDTRSRLAKTGKHVSFLQVGYSIYHPRAEREIYRKLISLQPGEKYCSTVKSTRVIS